MKKFLDFTHDQHVASKFPNGNMIPLGALAKHNISVKRIIEKLTQGLKAERFPHILFFDSIEALNSALFLHVYTHDVVETGKNQFLIEATASIANLELAKHLKKFQINCHLVALDKEGRISLGHLKEKISAKTALFSQRVYQPILGTNNDQHSEISELLNSNKILYHVDVTGSLGETFFDLEAIEADFVSLDLNRVSSSLNGAILLSRRALNDLVIVPKEIEIQDLEKALSSLETLYEESASKMLTKITHKMKLVSALKDIDTDIETVIKPPLESISKLVVHVPGIHQDALAFMLLSKSILVDLGAHHELPLKSLLMLLGYQEDFANSCISLTISDSFSDVDIEQFIEQFKKAWEILKKGAMT